MECNSLGFMTKENKRCTRVGLGWIVNKEIVHYLTVNEEKLRLVILFFVCSDINTKGKKELNAIEKNVTLLLTTCLDPVIYNNLVHFLNQMEEAHDQICLQGFCWFSL